MKRLLPALCLLAFPVAALAQQAPPQTLLEANVGSAIGPFWSPTQFQIVAKQFDQNPLKPSFVLRFQMEATNPAALYAPNGDRIGPAQVLVLTVPAKTTRTFYGTENLAYAAGAWSGPTVIENPAGKLGKPVDLYTVPTLVLGSTQYKDAVAAETSFSLDARKAAFQKQLDALEAADTDKAAAIAQSFAAGLQSLNSSFTEKLTAQQAALTGELGTMLTASRQALADQQKKVQESWTALIAKQHDALAGLSLGLEQTQQAVAAKIKLAQATLDSQKQLIALQQQALANNDQIDALKSKLAQKLAAQLTSFEGTWAGSMRCSKDNPWGIRATQVDMTLPKQIGGMLSGAMTVTGGDLGQNNGWGVMTLNTPIPATLQIINPNEPGPLQLNILTAGKTHPDKVFLNFELTLDPSGALKGIAVNHKDCTVVFSR
jgi:hypothetical protein